MTGKTGDLHARLDHQVQLLKAQVESMEDDRKPPAKRGKNLDGLVNRYTCPITQMLPVEPVCGSDGRVYEKGALEKWNLQSTTSPITREEMPGNLEESLLAVRTISELIEGGYIDESEAAEWQKKRAMKAHVTELLRKEANGETLEPKECLELADANYYGLWTKEDKEKAYGLYTKAYRKSKTQAENNEVFVRSLAKMGAIELTKADNDEGKTKRSLIFLAMACGGGSSYAAAKLEEYCNRPEQEDMKLAAVFTTLCKRQYPMTEEEEEEEEDN